MKNPLSAIRAFFGFDGPKVDAETAGIADAFIRGDSYYGRHIGNYGEPDAAMQVTALSACVRLISGNVAKLPFPVFRRNGEDRERTRTHPVDSLLNERPNRWQTANEFRKMLTAHVALYGNGYAVKVMNGAAVEELIPWHPSYVSVRQDDLYAPPIYELHEKRGRGRILQASEILHLRDLTLDGVIGLSRIDQARQGIDLARAAETYGTAYFRNGAEAGVVLETDQKLDDAAMTRLAASWKSSHQGPNRAHKPTILEGGLKFKPASASNKESQFLELRSFQVEDIARLYGVPPHLIGLTEKQTSWGSGVEQMAIGFLEFNLLDWLVMWETAVKRDLLVGPRDGNVFAEHVVDGLLRADMKTRADAYQIFIQNGILSRNECRRLENRPPYEGGDEFLTPLNMSTDAQNQNQNPRPQEAPVAFPSEAPQRAWMLSARRAQRALEARKAIQ